MSLVEDPNLYDILAPETLLDPDGIVNYAGIAAAAAELAHQFWLEIDAELTQQTAQYQVDADAGSL
jgi:hypothetical protein